MKHVEIESSAPISSEDAHKVMAKRAGRYSHLNDATSEDFEELENEPEGELLEDPETEFCANTEEVRVDCLESQTGGEDGNDESNPPPE